MRESSIAIEPLTIAHNPDVIMVGEMRDGETAHIGVHAPMTCHLVQLLAERIIAAIRYPLFLIGSALVVLMFFLI